MKLLNRKGQVISNLQGFVMAVVTIAVILAIGLYVLWQVQVAIEQANDSTFLSTSASVTTAGNATGTMMTKLATAPTWIGLLIVVVFASAILAYFYFKEG